MFGHSLFGHSSTIAAYIFTAPTCKATIISLEPCALNVEFSISFPDLIKFPYFMDTAETRVWGEGRPKDRVSLQIILVFTLTHPKPYTGAMYV